ncbi:heterokaryon incompatibility protein-domain-containing protein [Phyllosticta capitalensis]|uniref:heterokaryon incompatibility protein-domain-containing protein n=1 Tax=Phyllosticta capitalensis TaxID=121624 RepID=UPI00312F88BD
MSIDVTSPPSIDWDNIRSWLNESSAAQPLDTIPPGFRLVDVVKQAVVRAPQELLEYVCLSYVWGKPTKDDIFATSKTIAGLEEDGSLTKYKIPATIRDAMTVCQHLGQKYLWVDRLCILQDDDDASGQKKVQIEHMGDIYHHVFATLVAVTGIDARSGLCGVSSPLKEPRLKSGPTALQESKWATRGWTYQEFRLSSRLIFFFSFAARFSHRQSRPFSLQWTMRNVGSGFNPDIYSEETTIETYESSVEEYSSRDLGCQSDAMIAFSGVCAQFHGPHRFCLPRTGFDDAITWTVRQRPRQRRYSRGSPLFPSWSWVSIRGQVTFPEGFFAYHFPVASWAFVDSNFPHRFSIALPKAKEAHSFSPPPTLDAECAYLAHQAHTSGLILSAPAEILSLQDKDWDRLWKSGRDKRKFKEEWPTYFELWEACRGINRLDSQGQPPYFGEFSGAQKRLAMRDGRILGLSRAVYSNVGPVSGERSELADYIIYHGQKPVGVGWSDDVSDTQGLLEKKKVTLFALSIASSEWDSEKFSPSRDPKLAQFRDILHPRREAFPESQRDPQYGDHIGDVLEAIAIEETGETGVFRRIGSGMIRRQEWTEMGHEWKSIVLE